MKKLIAGNWKMNGSLAANQALVAQLHAGLQANLESSLQASPQASSQASSQGAAASEGCVVALCVPSVYLAQLHMLFSQFAGVGSAKFAINLGSQDISAHASGAFTGEISGAMLNDFAVRYAIVGHSERRLHHGETDALVSLKAKAALQAGITPIVCVGETLAEREAGATEAVVKRQLAAVIHDNGHCISEIVVAYEPVWAIGTGKTATPEMAQAVHAVLRAQIKAATPHPERVKILYGGSMNAANAAALLAQPDIDGGLIGGASLKSADFLAIVAAASR